MFKKATSCLPDTQLQPTLALRCLTSLSSAINDFKIAHQNRFQSIAHTANLAPTPTII